MNGLTRWDPFQELQSWSDRMSRVFGGERVPARTAGEEENLAFGT